MVLGHLLAFPEPYFPWMELYEANLREVCENDPNRQGFLFGKQSWVISHRQMLAVVNTISDKLAIIPLVFLYWNICRNLLNPLVFPILYLSFWFKAARQKSAFIFSEIYIGIWIMNNWGISWNLSCWLGMEVVMFSRMNRYLKLAWTCRYCMPQILVVISIIW